MASRLAIIVYFRRRGSSKSHTLDRSIASAEKRQVDNPLIVRRPSQMMQCERKRARQRVGVFDRG